MKNIIKVSIYILLSFLLIIYFSKVFVSKGTLLNYDLKMIDYYVVGASGIYNGISPMVIYDKIGVTGQNIASGDVQLPADYYLIKETTKKNKPKVIFLDGETFFATEMQSRELMHKTVDNFPLDLNKLEFVNEEAYNMDIKEKITYLFPFFRFHDRWNELKNNDFKFKTNNKLEKRRGFWTFSEIISNDVLELDYMNKKDNIDEMKKIYEKNYSEVYLKKIKKYCNENNIYLELLVLPRQNWSLVKHNILQEIANKNSIKLIDMNVLKNELNFDISKDLYNANHSNISGAIKASEYLAKYIADNYKIEDHRNDSNYDNWNKDLKEYKEEEFKLLKEYNDNLEKNIEEE